VHKLAEFLTSDSLTAQGFFEFEGFTGHLPMKRARDFQGVDADLRRLQHALLVLHRPLHPWDRGLAPISTSSSPRRRVWPAEGVREVTLLGQNVNSYGRDLRPRRREFSELLRALDDVGVDRVRYTSPHPKDMREDVIRCHAELESLCEHIHLPLQSGSTRILKAMRRTYTRERYLDRVALIREHVPDVALTTDIIVGFPGRDRGRLRADARRGEEVGYDGAFTFIYSPRRGTEAAELTEGLVPHEVSVERMERLVEVVQRRARERAQRFVGRTMEVLVEGTSRTDAVAPARAHAPRQGGQLRGLAEPGELVQVEITVGSSQTLTGRGVAPRPRGAPRARARTRPRLDRSAPVRS
jgi:tRNA-2-methylthio-N6-dimethylallyladenosine synthase